MTKETLDTKRIELTSYQIDTLQELCCTFGCSFDNTNFNKMPKSRRNAFRICFNKFFPFFAFKASDSVYFSKDNMFKFSRKMLNYLHEQDK